MPIYAYGNHEMIPYTTFCASLSISSTIRSIVWVPTGLHTSEPRSYHLNNERYEQYNTAVIALERVRVRIGVFLVHADPVYSRLYVRLPVCGVDLCSL